jgi:hypothetical protein
VHDAQRQSLLSYSLTPNIKVADQVEEFRAVSPPPQLLFIAAHALMIDQINQNRIKYIFLQAATE